MCNISNSRPENLLDFVDTLQHIFVEEGMSTDYGMTAQRELVIKRVFADQLGGKVGLDNLTREDLRGVVMGGRREIAGPRSANRAHLSGLEDVRSAATLGSEAQSAHVVDTSSGVRVPR